MNLLEFEYIQFSSLCQAESQFSNFEICLENSLISFFISWSENKMTLEDGAYFAKGEMPSSSNTHAIPWGNILLWTTPPLLAYTALKLSTWIYCVCYCCLLLSKHNNQTTNNNNNSDNQYRTGHPTTTTQFLDVIVTDLSGVFEILACHSSFWKGEDGTISTL